MKKIFMVALLLSFSTLVIAEITSMPEITNEERDFASYDTARGTIMIGLLLRSGVKQDIAIMASSMTTADPESTCAKAARTVIYGNYNDAIYAVNLLNKGNNHDSICSTKVITKENVARQYAKNRKRQELMKLATLREKPILLTPKTTPAEEADNRKFVKKNICSSTLVYNKLIETFNSVEQFIKEHGRLLSVQNIKTDIVGSKNGKLTMVSCVGDFNFANEQSEYMEFGLDF
jgi:hypothetical protein